MNRSWPLLLALAAVLAGPILWRPKGGHGTHADELVLVIVTPHNEAIRSEFGRAFADQYYIKTNRHVRVDWRTPGGTSEIGRYLESEYAAAFRNHWEHNLGRTWSTVVEKSFGNAMITPGEASALDTPAQQARRAFLSSEVGCRIDLFFGGGAYDFQQQAKAGRLVDCGFIAAHPEIFGDGPGRIPQALGGEPFWDAQGRWIGNAVSSFGICYNTDALARLGIASPPTRWADLADPRFLHEIALANPTQSSSVNKAFEMLIQQQMQEAGPDGVGTGWTNALRVLMKIGANSRYFTDSSTKIALDVEAGEAAAGMTIDFYGRFQSEAVRKADGTSRLQYGNATGGTSVGVDPIGLLRGAPHAELAREFIGFVMSPGGQKLWNWKVGAPGGPERYALRRLPVLPALYAPEFGPLRSDPEVDPYSVAQTFTYHDQWTAALFRSIAFTFRVMCIDPHDELTAAWRALIASGFPPEATAAFEDVRAVDYAVAGGRMREALGGDKIKEVQLARELADHFRAQYQRAADLARAHR